MNLGIDIGGTSIKMGIVDHDGRIVAKHVYLESFHDDTLTTIKRLKDQIDQFLSTQNMSSHDLESIGIGCPGVINSQAGSVDFAGNLRWNNVKLADELKSLHPNVYVTNDANAAGLGEALYGAGKNYRNLVMVTLGTGVGGAVILDKKLFEGEEGKGTEIGHMIIKYHGSKCSCGLKGCLEAYASANALIKQTKKAMKKDVHSDLWKIVDHNIDKVDGRTAFAGEKLGDKTAQHVVSQYISYLGTGLLNICNIFRPEAIIMGGGLSAQKENLSNRLTDFLKKYHYGFLMTPPVTILCAELGNDAGIIGAAHLHQRAK